MSSFESTSSSGITDSSSSSSTSSPSTPRPIPRTMSRRTSVSESTSSSGVTSSSSSSSSDSTSTPTPRGPRGKKRPLEESTINLLSSSPLQSVIPLPSLPFRDLSSFQSTENDENDPNVVTSSSSESAPSDINTSTKLFARQVRVDYARSKCMDDPREAQKILNSFDNAIEVQGWCELVKKVGNKRGGYIQVSWKGANHMAVLQEIVLWAAGKTLGPGLECSHLCHNPRCRVKSHIWPESSVANNNRKGCLVWVDCPHCEKKIFLCSHEPACIKFCEGYNDIMHLRRTGVCKDIGKMIIEARGQSSD